jgi:hypothetical protein
LKKAPPPSKSFTWDVIDINPKTKEYTLKNKATGKEWVISRERYLEIVKEQKKA